MTYNVFGGTLNLAQLNSTHYGNSDTDSRSRRDYALSGCSCIFTAVVYFLHDIDSLYKRDFFIILFSFVAWITKHREKIYLSKLYSHLQKLMA